MNARPAHLLSNEPPTPFDALKTHIDDLDLEARNHLDGEGIATQEQADAVSKILDDARKAKAAADEQRKIEAKPFDEGKAAVQARWKPLLERAELTASVAKRALSPWLTAKEAEQRAAAQAAAQEASQQAEAAALIAQQVRPDDLAGQTTLRVKQENAAAAEKVAQRLSKARSTVKGGERANSLRSRWTAILADPVAALRHYRDRRPDELKLWLVEQANRDVRAGARSIPGFTIDETPVVV